MNGCPTQDLLDDRLSERLEGKKLAQIELHLETCPRCRVLRQKLTRRSGRKVIAPAVEKLPRIAAPAVSPAIDTGRTTAIRTKVHETTVEPFRDGPGEAPVCAATPFGDLRDARVPDGAQLAASPIADRTTVPGYEIVGRLGEGGMGVVYEALHLGLKRRVALKMIRGGRHSRPEHLARLRIEAEVVARLGHPNIVQIFDIGEADGLPFVSLELLEGGRLSDRLNGTPQQGPEAAKLVACLALAVDSAHKAGIIHRDLKPANVLFASDGTPKITDFGLAKRIDSEDHHTESGQIMGSPSYMPPEQARGHSPAVGTGADIYALGAILYEMLTGRPPFKGATPMDTVRQVIDAEPVPPSRLVPRLPKDLETICLKCLNKDRHKRYESARALADDLSRYLAGEPIKARPATRGERAAKWARRNPLSAAVWVLGASAVVATIVGAFVQEQTVAARQTTALILLEKADAARSEVELEQAQLELSEFFPLIKNKARLKLIADRVIARRASIADRLASMHLEQSRRDARQAARARFEKFCSLRDATQVYAAHLTVLDPAEHINALRATALAALAVYGREPGAKPTRWQIAEPIDGALDPAEASEVKEGCYDLLLILSEIEAPADGLQLLDHAAVLRPEPTTAYHTMRAFCLGHAGDKAGQAREERLARSTRPVSAFDHLLQGREKFARSQRMGRGQLTPGNFREAIRSAQAALRLDPNQLGAHLLLAVVYFNSNRFSEAKASLNACFRRAPDLLGLYLFRAKISGDEGSQALGHIKDSAATASEWRDEAAASFAAAEEDYRRALDLRPDPNFRYVLLVNRGGMYLQAGRLDQALADLEAASKLNARLYHAHALLAQVYHRLGQLDQSAHELDLAIERQPELPSLFRARAFLVSRAHESGNKTVRDTTPPERARAIADLREAIRLEAADSPQAADDHVELGRLLGASGQSAEALAAYEAAIRIKPDDPVPLRQRALALLELERYDEVLAASDAYLASGRLSADVLSIRAQARFARKDFAGAIADDTVALALTPQAPELLDHRGWAYVFSNAFALALADFDAAIKVNPSLAHAYSGRGLARVGLGSWREALTDADTGVRLAPATGMQSALYSAARVHALSLKFAAEDVSRRGESALTLHRKLRDRTALLLVQSAHKLPPDKQPRFWRDVVASDPLLRPFAAQ